MSNPVEITDHPDSRLGYALIGNIFTLSIFFFGYSHYGALEVQVTFAMSIIVIILIGLVHDQKNIFYEESMCDGLTGLANMRLFKKLSSSMIASAHRNREKNAFLFFDIDGFKEPLNNSPKSAIIVPLLTT
jgi:predicted signal transduction protein with EAL and GGDEF domain